MEKRILDIAKTWAKNFGCDILYEAGEEDGIAYFNARERDMIGGYCGLGANFAVTPEGKVIQLGSLTAVFC
jgi:hypothetical protein